jgi:hypothetical protein
VKKSSSSCQAFYLPSGAEAHGQTPDQDELSASSFLSVTLLAPTLTPTWLLLRGTAPLVKAQ